MFSCFWLGLNVEAHLRYIARHIAHHLLRVLHDANVTGVAHNGIWLKLKNIHGFRKKQSITPNKGLFQSIMNNFFTEIKQYTPYQVKKKKFVFVRNILQPSAQRFKLFKY